MGGKQSKVEVEGDDLAATIPHEKLTGGVTVDLDTMMFNFPVINQIEYEKWVKNLALLEEFEKTTLIFPKKHEFSRNGFCGDSGDLKVYYDLFIYVLTEEISNRLQGNNLGAARYFSEKEIWFLLLVLVSNAKIFKTLDRKVGDIRPENVLLDQFGNIKLANCFSWPQELTNYEKTLFEKLVTNLSPEEMAAIAENKQTNPTNIYLSESFSIGLTVLETCLRFEAKSLYNLQSYKFDEELLKKKLDELWNYSTITEAAENRTYSRFLKETIIGMCQVDPKKRASSFEVEQNIRPYFDQIVAFVPFTENQVSNEARTVVREQTKVQDNQVFGVNAFSKQGNIFNIPQPQQQGQRQGISGQFMIPGPAINPPALPFQQAFSTYTQQPQQKMQAPITTLQQARPVSSNQFTSFVTTHTKQEQFQFHQPPAQIQPSQHQQPQIQPTSQAASGYSGPAYLIPEPLRNSSAPKTASNDILRKIEEQLEQSRRMFPS